MMGVRGRREKISSKVFPFFPDHKVTFVGNRAKHFEQVTGERSVRIKKGCFLQQPLISNIQNYFILPVYASVAESSTFMLKNLLAASPIFLSHGRGPPLS